MDNNTVYEWILQEFTVPNRAKGLQVILDRHLYDFVRSGDQVLDLCCGAGGMSFWFEEQGARVTGMDFASYMIGLARAEALWRNSTVEFIHANILLEDLGQGSYDLISCFGNSISDFPISDFARLGKKVARALKPGGCFVVQYHDGSYRYMQGIAKRSGVYQETPERVTFTFKEYLPEIGANVQKIRNETRGEEYQRMSYIYTVPMVRLALDGVLDLTRHIVLEENHFLDVFTRQRAD